MLMLILKLMRLVFNVWSRNPTTSSVKQIFRRRNKRLRKKKRNLKLLLKRLKSYIQKLVPR
uniref:Atg6 n=1 Tax=Arundo donax TaxID=35708 RepID=A0A0A9E1P3_ARUDO